MKAPGDHRLGPRTVVLGLLLLLTGCSRQNRDSGIKVGSQTDPDPIRYVKVLQQELTGGLDLPAKVQADPTKVIRIFPPASGRVLGINVKPGDRVRPGETVATLSSSDVASAQSDFAKASIEAQRAKQEMERQKVLFQHGAIAERDYLDTRAQANTAQAELTRAKQRLQLLNIHPSASNDMVTLVSPDSGVVLDVGAAPGEFSKSLESASPLVTIADLSTVWIVGEVYEKDIAKIARDDRVDVTLEAFVGRKWKGHIASISGALDPASRTLSIRVVLPNPDHLLKPEMFATIHVYLHSHEALVVPATAIIHEGNTTSVFVKSPGQPERHSVTIGQVVDGKVEIVKGLNPGEEVAADGAELLKGGSTE